MYFRNKSWVNQIDRGRRAASRKWFPGKLCINSFKKLDRETTVTQERRSEWRSRVKTVKDSVHHQHLVAFIRRIQPWGENLEYCLCKLHWSRFVYWCSIFNIVISKYVVVIYYTTSLFVYLTNILVFACKSCLTNTFSVRLHCTLLFVNKIYFEILIVLIKLENSIFSIFTIQLAVIGILLWWTLRVTWSVTARLTLT